QQQPVPQQQGTTTRSGRTIRPPGEWWKADTRHQGETQDEPQSEPPSNIDPDASNDYDDNHPMPDAPALDDRICWLGSRGVETGLQSVRANLLRMRSMYADCER